MIQMLDQIKKDIRNLIKELIRLENEINNLIDDNITDQRLDDLITQEIGISEQIDDMIKSFDELINNLRNDADNNLVDTLKKMQNFIDQYDKDAEELCVALRDNPEKNNFINENRLVLTEFYKDILKDCVL